jgi:hypothetical protein
MWRHWQTEKKNGVLLVDNIEESVGNQYGFMDVSSLEEWMIFASTDNELEGAVLKAIFESLVIASFTSTTDNQSVIFEEIPRQAWDDRLLRQPLQ